MIAERAVIARITRSNPPRKLYFAFSTASWVRSLGPQSSIRPELMVAGKLNILSTSGASAWNATPLSLALVIYPAYSLSMEHLPAIIAAILAFVAAWFIASRKMVTVQLENAGLKSTLKNLKEQLAEASRRLDELNAEYNETGKLLASAKTESTELRKRLDEQEEQLKKEFQLLTSQFLGMRCTEFGGHVILLG